MTRIALLAAAVIAIIGIIGIIGVFWTASSRTDTSEPDPTGVAAPPLFDTTGGQAMRPRWNQGEGQGDDATNK